MRVSTGMLTVGLVGLCGALLCTLMDLPVAAVQLGLCSVGLLGAGYDQRGVELEEEHRREVRRRMGL